MATMHTVITLLLALIFLIAGLSKASGSSAGLSGTRDVGFPDGLARLVGLFETLASTALVIGFALDNSDLELYGYIVIWFVMAGALFFHFRANKIRTGFPAMLLIVLATLGIATL
ncbi:MAG: DoxX family protein [Acidobacteria bacterium]|nr:DoxX family protein [Acidobacteriota bacterium]